MNGDSVSTLSMSQSFKAARAPRSSNGRPERGAGQCGPRLEVVGLPPRGETLLEVFIKQTASRNSAAGLLAEATRAGRAKDSASAGARVRIKTPERESAQTLREVQAKLRESS